MKRLYLYNSLSNNLDEFHPIDESNIRMYACGPTVYSGPHVGNARPLVVFDVLFRLLSFLYPKVTYVRNITDVDDKINKRAAQRKITIRELTDEVIENFHNDLSSLNILPPTVEPRATFHIQEMIDVIQKLLDNGYAYQTAAHVLLSVKKLPNYGILSKRSLNQMIPGSRVEIGIYKRDPLDFVLWKPSRDNEPSWDSPFGPGRPGWHIECSAMSHKYLGAQFDIHAGGHDLIFPHHENEIAQNYGAFGCLMANYWIHNELVLVDNLKMSKSIGNVISISDVLQKMDGEIIRYVLLSSHYQKKLNWTDQAIHQAQQSLNKMYSALNLVTEFVETNYDESIIDALCSNLNTPLALSHLINLADEILKEKDQSKINYSGSVLKKSASILGLLFRENWFKRNLELPEEKIEELIEQRNQARKEKDYKKADEIRNYLTDHHISIEDTPSGTTWKVV